MRKRKSNLLGLEKRVVIPNVRPLYGQEYLDKYVNGEQPRRDALQSTISPVEEISNGGVPVKPKVRLLDPPCTVQIDDMAEFVDSASEEIDASGEVVRRIDDKQAGQAMYEVAQSYL